ncbi:hypothetical protein KY289_030216 [Solanum tuberosum]|nr:hypothetical protein KY289_030216 [Solanum tuberosum]
MDEDLVSSLILLCIKRIKLLHQLNFIIDSLNKADKDGELDESLSFLNMPMKHIMASSNDLLLCCSNFFKENLNYVVCNPVTREINVIPQPLNVYTCVVVTFICKRNDHDCNINYEILRVGVPKPLTPLTMRSSTYKIETFSSLNVANYPGFVLEDDDDDVIYWYDLPHSVVVYDRSMTTEENIQLLKLPKDGGYKTSSEWVLKFKVSLTEMNKDNPNTSIGTTHFWISINPNTSIGTTTQFWYDFETGKLHEAAREINDQDDNTFEALREAEEIDKGESNESKREGESTKDWVNETFALKEQKDKGRTGKKRLKMNKNEEKCYNDINEGAIVVAEVNDMKILPLALQMDDEKVGEDQNWDLKQSSKQNMENVEKDNSSQNKSHVAVEDNQGLEKFRRRLGMEQAVASTNGKIRAFIDEIFEYELIRDEEQMLTIKLMNQGLGIIVLISLICAKYTQIKRLRLWESMYELAKHKNDIMDGRRRF